MADRRDLPFISLPEDDAATRPAATVPAALAKAETRALPPPPAPAMPADDADKLLDRLSQQHRAIEDALRNYARVAKERDELALRAASLERELAEARAKLRDLQAGSDRTRERQEKLEASMVALSTENAKLKSGLGELEQRARVLEQRLASADAALQGTREARDEAERRIDAGIAALQPRR